MLAPELLARRGDTVIAVSDGADRDLWPQLRLAHPGLLIVSTEGVMMSVIRQQLILKPYRLK